jgi:DNA end-binding protein Ku
MVSFGLVTIPVKLYSTGEAAAGIQLNMLHRKCGSRLKQQYVCPLDDVVVGRDEMVKGYEYAKGQYVLFSEDELKALTREATNAIEITEFVPLEQVDPIYFERSYYLGPDKGGERPYRLLAEAMKQTSRAALARYAARGKDYLVLLRPFEEGLIMQQLRYHDELRPFSEVPVGPAAEVREPELKLAKQIIDQIASDRFDPQSYEDEVRKQTLDLIDKKVAGQEISAAPAEAPKAQIIDLMAALKASLGSSPRAESPAGRSDSRSDTAASRRQPTPGPATAGRGRSAPAPARAISASSRQARAARAVPATATTTRTAPAAAREKPARGGAAASRGQRAEPAAAPAIAGRKPPKPSPRTSLRLAPAVPAVPKRKGSKG